MDYDVYSAYGSSPAISAAAMIPSIIIGIIVCVIAIVAMWKIFTKAGKPGWAAIVPFYNLYVLYEISWGNGLLFLLNLIVFIAPILSIITMVKLGKAFGKSGGFIVGLILLAPIFILILAFGDAQYIGPNGVPAVAETPVAPPPVAE